MTNRRRIRYQLEVTRENGSKEIIQANSVRKDALKRAAFVAQDAKGWPTVVSVAVRDIMGMESVIATFDRSVETFATVDAAHDDVLNWFRALGRSHAAFAIDAIKDYEDSYESHRQNLSDTLWDEHRNATSYQVEVCVEAYDAAWEAHLNPAGYATIEQAQQMELGCTGDVVRISGCRFERLVDRHNKNLFCWISHSFDDKGEVCDWDLVPESDATEMGLIR